MAKKGQVLVMFAFLLPVLIGMLALILDSGYMFLNRRIAQNAADASALAGAVSLCHGDDPFPVAEFYAEANGAELLESNQDEGFYVLVKISYPCLFSNFLGWDDLQVYAEAAAHECDPTLLWK